MTTSSASGEWVKLCMRTRRCKSCNERYGRRIKYCPVCKTPKGSRGQPPPFAAGVGFRAK